jgi:hypothetical protein
MRKISPLALVHQVDQRFANFANLQKLLRKAANRKNGTTRIFSLAVGWRRL